MRKKLFLFIISLATYTALCANDICWESHDDPGTTFLVFGTNLPDVTITDGKEVLSSEDFSFVGETNETSLSVDESYSKYSVLPFSNGQFASPLPQRELKTSSSKKAKVAQPYIKNPYVSDEIWNMLQPYFLPHDFPERAILDSIFSKQRVLASTKAMAKAGFIIITNPKDKIIVAKHPRLSGYLFKVYLDSQDIPDWMWWKKRIEGQRVIQASIDRHGYQHIMKTPKKWAYPIPSEPSPPPGSFRKNFVLMVEKMDILDNTKNRAAYKKKMDKERLDALYTVIMENLLIDAVYCDNTPFCSDGRLAFIDTEHAQDTTQPVPISSIAQYLSKPMHAYWEQVIQYGVQP